ncbi:MAG: hypothetical protein NHF87_00690 [Candidatus Shikimatogenerans bostrichidophilus]|nr:MAG: hypothetical protein NHF87_00690 [Candidatus Shikimatogenerans bostrichidophilus]
MSYILNIYEKNKFIYSNITYNGKLFIKIKKNYNSFHYYLLKSLRKNNINITIINAISVNLGPAISYTRIRNILATAKGFCLSLNIPLIKLNSFLLLINYKKKIINKYKIINFIIHKHDNSIFIVEYNFKKKEIKHKKYINNIKKYIIKNNNKIFFLINKNLKKNYKKIKKLIFFYKIPYNYINKFSYKLYLNQKFIKNINICLPIYI